MLEKAKSPDEPTEVVAPAGNTQPVGRNGYPSTLEIDQLLLI
jgi:hypothetical protein